MRRYSAIVLALGVCLSSAVASAQTPAREIRATRLAQPLKLDGRLDEEIYATVKPEGDFVQQLPHEKQPATEPTDIWIFFDDDNVYVAMRCTDSHPERMISNELRRDNRNI